MTKDIVKKSRLPKALIATLACFTAIGMTGCSSNKMPLSGIEDTEYASTKDGKYSISTLDLYQELRFNGYEYLTKTIDNTVFDKDLTLVKNIYNNNLTDAHGFFTSKEKIKEELDSLVLNAIYGTDEEDDIKEFTDKEIKTKVNTYITTIHNDYGIQVSFDDIVTNEDYSKLYELYFIDVAKKAFAYDKLVEDFAEAKKTADKDKTYYTDEYDAYFTNSAISSHYNQNFINQKDISGLLIRFYNSEEADQTLKAFGLKSYNSQLWYCTNATSSKAEADSNPDLIHIDDWYKQTTIDVTATNVVALSLGATDANELSSDTAKKTSNLAKAQTLAVYIELYNYIYSNYRTALTYENRNVTTTDYIKVVGQILNNTSLNYDKMASDLQDDFYKTKDEIDKYSTSLTALIYNTFKTSAPKNTEDEANFNYAYTQFSTSARSYGSSYFMYFKLAYEADEELYSRNADGLLEKPDDDSENYHYNEKIYNELIQKMIEDTLTTDFIKTKADEAIDKIKVSIFDTVLSAQYKLQNPDYSTTKKSSKDTIFKITYEKRTVSVKVAEYYDYLETKYGSNIAINLLMKKAIKDTQYYTNAAKKLDTYKKNISDMLSAFANDSYASYGYPASLGKSNFLLLYFHSTDINTVIENSFMIEEALSSYKIDMTTDMINKFTGYSRTLFDAFYSSSAKQMIVYFDENDDAVADSYENKKATVNNVEITIEQLINQLIDDIHEELENTPGSHSDAIAAFETEYNSTARRKTTDYIFSPEDKWSIYKLHGICVKITSLDITNDSDENAEIMDRIEEIYEETDRYFYRIEGTFPSEYIDNKIFKIEVKNKEVQAFEHSFLILTGGTNKSSSEYTEKDDEDSKVTINGVDQYAYSNIPVLYTNSNGDKLVVYLNAYSDDDYIKLNQAQIYLYQTLEFGNVSNLPTSVQESLQTYFSPIITRYTDTNNIINLFDFFLGGSVNQNGTTTYGLSFSVQSNQTQYENYLQNSRKILNEFNDELDYVYNDWWNSLSEIKNN